MEGLTGVRIQHLVKGETVDEIFVGSKDKKFSSNRYLTSSLRNSSKNLILAECCVMIQARKIGA